MKKFKILWTVLLLFIVQAVASAAFDNAVQNVVKPPSYWWLGDPQKDQGLRWMKEVERKLEVMGIDDTNSITFKNGGSLSNLTDGAMILSEAAEDLSFTFTTNAVQLTSSTGVLTVDFNDLYQTFNEIAAPTGNPPANKGWLYVKDDAATTKLFFEDSAGTVTDILASASGNTLNAAYDQGGGGAGRSITADTGAVAIANTDSAC